MSVPAQLAGYWSFLVYTLTHLDVLKIAPVRSGPYRFVRHPNYLAVFCELLALPLVHGAYLTAVFGSLLHLLILRRRVTLEESILMADESYRRAFAAKPRFLPWPIRL